MRSFAKRLIVVLLATCFVFPALTANAVGKDVSLYISYEGNAHVGSEVNIRISVSKPKYALAGLEFLFDYDEEYLRPKYTENTEENRELDVLTKNAPYNWEQMSYHLAEDGSYHFRYVMPDNEKSYLDAAGELEIVIPFVVIKAGAFEATINDRDIIAVYADDCFTVSSGVGGRLEMTAYDKAQRVGIELIGHETAYEDGIYYAKMKATNLGDAQGIIALELALNYDKSVFKPIITENKASEMDDFMSEMTLDWEQMCSLDAEKGVYTLRFAATHAESITLAESIISGDSIVIKVPFEVIGDEGAVGSLFVKSESVIAINGINEIYGGYGDASTAYIEKGLDFDPAAFGYEVKDGCILNIPEKTEINEFLSKFYGVYMTDADGNEVTSGYICTGYIVRDKADFALTVVTKGDCDGDGKIGTSDYLLAKRICFDTFSPTKAQLYSVALTDGIKVSSTDYVMLKRHCFGSFKIG